MPTEAERAELWRRYLAPAAPLADEVDVDWLVRQFDLSGAGIRNAVLAAAFLAAAAGRPVGMSQLTAGVAREMQKLGRMVTREKFGTWYEHVTATP